MSYVIAAPEMMATAATDLAGIGSALSEAHAAAAAPTVALVPAAADEVSASIAQLFSQHAASYQAMAGQAAAFNDQFATTLKAGAFSYTSIEAAITRFLQFLTAFGNGLVSIAVQNPVEFALGTLLFLVLLPVDVLVLPFLLPLAAILVAA
jgi:hypothetical protein